MLATLAMDQCDGATNEPVKLAMASSNTTSSTNAVRVPTKFARTDTNSFSLSFQQPATSPALPAATPARPADDAHSAVTVVVLKQDPRASTGLFSRQPGNGNFGFANIEAGYGQAYDCDSIVLRGRNGTTWEETRYIFFKKVVKF